MNKLALILGASFSLLMNSQVQADEVGEVYLIKSRGYYQCTNGGELGIQFDSVEYREGEVTRYYLPPIVKGTELKAREYEERLNSIVFLGSIEFDMDTYKLSIDNTIHTTCTKQ